MSFCFVGVVRTGPRARQSTGGLPSSERKRFFLKKEKGPAERERERQREGERVGKREKENHALRTTKKNTTKISTSTIREEEE